MSKLYKFDPDYASHPGEHLLELMEAERISTEELAVKLRVSVAVIGGITIGRDDMTPDLALRLEHVYEVPAAFWLKLQEFWEHRNDKD